MNKPSSRQDGHSLLTSFIHAQTIRRLEKQIATLRRENGKLQQLIEESKKREQHKDRRLDKLQQSIETLKRQVAESKAHMLQAAKESKVREEKMLQAANESKVRENKMLEAQEESNSKMESIQQSLKSSLYAAMGSTLIGDLLIDFYKEVVKKTIGEETLEALSREIREWIGPWLSALLGTVISGFPILLLIIKAAITIMVIAAPILNLTAVVWKALRAGLGKLRSKRASKK